MNDGRIVARKITSYQDSGAYLRFSSYGSMKHAGHMPGPYTIPNVWVDARVVFTNRPPSSAMRGFGVMAASFAIELQMDKVAKTIGMDPWQLRLLNAYRNGDMRAQPQGQRGRSDGGDHPGGGKACRSRAAGGIPSDDLLGQKGKLMAKVRGTGFAAVNYPTGMHLGGDPTQSLIHMTPAGGLRRHHGERRSRPGAQDRAGADCGGDPWASPTRASWWRPPIPTPAPHCTGTFAEPHHAPRRQRGGDGGAGGAQGDARGRGRAVGGEPGRSRDRRRTATSTSRAWPRGRSPVGEVAGAAHFGYGKTIAGRGAYLKPPSPMDPETGECDPDSTPGAPPVPSSRSRSIPRPGWSRCLT